MGLKASAIVSHKLALVKLTVSLFQSMKREGAFPLPGYQFITKIQWENLQNILHIAAQ